MPSPRPGRPTCAPATPCHLLRSTIESVLARHLPLTLPGFAKPLACPTSALPRLRGRDRSSSDADEYGAPRFRLRSENLQRHDVRCSRTVFPERGTLPLRESRLPGL